MPSSKNDNSLGKAQNLGTLGSSLVVGGKIGQKDKVDFLKFSVSGSSSFSATLTGLKGNVDLAIRDKNGNILAQSRRPGRKSESVAGTLGTGIFYVQVKARTSFPSSRYRLSLSAILKPGGGTDNGGNDGGGGNGNTDTGGGGGNTRLKEIPIPSGAGGLQVTADCS
ncbi:MAG: hypothetical protein KME07_21345 [Pegethrix bostrychoides GSE-TBD4-15B]|uniref:Peptidase C-terminal archaeal/bacterial domain-containing protein n=1 Tax=Pegethrix bostrychoides GSE-TBD4-15B TaxID=2839662 RepID=A0A951PG54_9CYAN|nr:hypothetical protein [Pegethrix bostrychoides GSE-TBD4-15B]